MALPVDSDNIKTCTACGASIYQEHLDRGLAGMWAGQLLCPPCLKTQRDQPAHESAAPLSPQEKPSPPAPARDIEDAPPVVLAPEPADKEPPAPAGTGARRVRTFHAKLSEGAVQHLDEQINSWLAANPHIEIKFVTTTTGIWEAKHPEPTLILTVFY